MNYEKEIINILLEAGSEGLKATKISRHVFNACNSFFEPISFEDVHAQVYQFLLKNSNGRYSLIEKGQQRGVYRLNMNNQESRQLMLEFADDTDDDSVQEVKRDCDTSLGLFD